MSMNHEDFAENNPIPYDGEVRCTGGEDGETWSIVEAANWMDIPEIIERVGEWAICEDGIYSLYIYTYYIGKDRLWEDEDEWIEHMSDKPWVRLADFIAVFRRARHILYN